MATLERIALLARAILAAHVALQFMDRRPLRSPDNIERDGLMGLAAEALHFEVAVAGVERIAEGRGRLCRSLEGEHAGVPGLTGEPVGVPAALSCPLGQMPDGGAEHVLSRLGAHCQ